jgi:hypothetical protein
MSIVMPDTRKPKRASPATAAPEARSEAEYPLRKPVNTLAIVPKSEKITVTARKIYNVMLHYAQRQGVGKDLYQVRLADIATGIDFNSNNTQVIKQYFRQMATTGVEWQSPTTGEGARWSVSALIAHADLIQRGGELILEWSYAPNIKQELLDPQRFAKMSLQVQASLNTMASLVLYEICCRYADNPGGLTARQHWSWWRPVLTGAPDSPTSAYQEYKIFNRDVLKKAVRKVNDVSDLDIELVEHRVGRAIQDLQFRVRRKTPALAPADRPIEPVDLKTIGAAIKAGIPQERAEKHLLKFGAKALDEALRVMQERLSRPNMEPVRSPEKYLLTLLQSGQFGEPQAPAAATRKVFDTKAERVKLIERFMAMKRTELAEMFQEMPEADRETWIARFETEALPASDVMRKAFRTKGIAAPLVRPLFLKFLGNAVWEDGWDKPTDSDLVDLAILTKEEESADAAPTQAKLRL